MQQYNFLKWFVLIVLLLIAIGTSVFSLFMGESFYSFLLNLSTELFGAVITYFLFELIISHNEKKSELRIQSFKDLHNQDDFIRKDALKDILSLRLISNSIIENLKFDGVILRSQNFSKSKFYYVSFFGVDFSLSKFKKSLFFENDIRGSNLTNTSFKFCDLTKSNLCNSFLTNSYFKKTLFIEVCLENTDISKSSFLKCDFTNTIFKNTNVSESIFVKPINLSETQKEYLSKNGAILKS